MQPLIIYSAQDSPRLRYVLNWIFTERLNISYKLVHDITALENRSLTISYGNTVGAVSIPATRLLFYAGIHQQEIAIGEWQSIPTLFHAQETAYTLPFDIFSAIFFLLSRYEEYYPYTADKHGRYPATESVLYKNKLLRRPIVDEWVEQFRLLLQNRFAQPIAAPAFSYLPTYDIDIAYSYLHKGAARSVGGLAKDLLNAKLKKAAERVSVLGGGKADPYDSFGFIQSLHLKSRPIFFILAALQSTAFDKNISPRHEKMQQLIHSLSSYAYIGMHPSYYTAHDNIKWLAEKTALETITNKAVSVSRQHYIKLSLPDTYRHLLQNEILSDYSMGYGTHLGFRAGTGAPFSWYDLQKEELTELRIYPFCFMDTTAHFDEGLDVQSAFDILNAMTQKLKENNSMLITVFHNFSLGADAEWSGWAEAYKQFLNLQLTS